MHGVTADRERVILQPQLHVAVALTETTFGLQRIARVQVEEILGRHGHALLKAQTGATSQHLHHVPAGQQDTLAARQLVGRRQVSFSRAVKLDQTSVSLRPLVQRPLQPAAEEPQVAALNPQDGPGQGSVFVLASDANIDQLQAAASHFDQTRVIGGGGAGHQRQRWHPAVGGRRYVDYQLEAPDVNRTAENVPRAAQLQDDARRNLVVMIGQAIFQELAQIHFPGKFQRFAMVHTVARLRQRRHIVIGQSHYRHGKALKSLV